MIDSLIRPRIDSTMDKMAVSFARSGMNANTITAAGFAIGLAGCFLVAMQMYWPGLLLLLVAFFLNGLDGAVARLTEPTELGAYLDMMSGVALFALFPFFFMLSGTNHATGAAILLLGFLLMGMANLAYDYFAMKKGAAPAGAGLVETGEIVIFIVLSCAYPDGFSFFAATLAIMSIVAAVLRVAKTIKLLKN